AGIKPLGPLASGGAPDPHVWMDPTLWGQCSAVAARALTDLLPDKAETIAKRQAAYLSQIKTLHEEIRALFEAVPTDRRVMVTSHDAFAYFGRAYEIEVHAVIGISTEQQPRPRDVEALHSLVRSRSVKALFIETSTSATLNAIVEKVAQETGASVGGTLYSDSLGSLGTPAGTYLGMMRHNARTIADAFTQVKP
ncbi:MAG: zinc ABC transporter substrate-binding protein, partial [Phycisphaerae bacterium]|nr:zinc ABC transporter substrate-binding protein [Phycisphaerae bacterium]